MTSSPRHSLHYEFAGAYLPHTPTAEIDDDLVQVVHSLITNLRVTTTKLEDIQQVIIAAKTLQKVKLNALARQSKNVIFSVRPNRNIHDNLYVANGIVFSDQLITVPLSLKSQILGLIYESHFGIEKSKSRTRELLYWPKMGAGIERTVTNCKLCIKYQNNLQREPVIFQTSIFLKMALMYLH